MKKRRKHTVKRLWHHVGPRWCHMARGTTWAPSGATQPMAPYGAPNVVPHGLWHHMGPPMWCHTACGTTWGPVGVTQPVTPRGPHAVSQSSWHHIGPKRMPAGVHVRRMGPWTIGTTSLPHVWIPPGIQRACAYTGSLL